MKLSWKLLVAVVVANLLSGCYSKNWGLAFLNQNQTFSAELASKSNSINRQPELSIFGPKTYFVGDQNITEKFQADLSSRYRLKVRASGSIQVDFIVNGQKQHLAIPSSKQNHEQT